MVLVEDVGSETESLDESKKPRAFRIGLTRRVGSEVVFKPAATVGLSADGGVFISPSQVLGTWQYGILESAVVATATSAETHLRPKLHYHRSGRVYPTLSGHDLERRSLEMTPLTALRRSQIFSVIVVRTWELPTRHGSTAWGDSSTAVKRWPDVATWTVWLLEASGDERRPLLLPGMPSVGLLAGDGFTHGVVSLSAYGREAVLLTTVSTDDTWEMLPPTGGITVTALPWHPGGPTEGDRCFGLWSSSLRNPMVKWQESAPEDLTPTWTTSVKNHLEDVDRMAEFTVPDAGLRERPPAVNWDDGSGTPFAKPKRDTRPSG